MPAAPDGMAEALRSAHISGKEAESFARHFQDPEFVKLFEAYAADLQDPATRAEHAAYLEQLEAEGQLQAVYGQGVELIVPEARLVLKTKDAAGHTRVYINLCTSDKVDEMTLVEQPGRAGRCVNLPLVLHGRTPKQGTAPDGGRIQVWDLATHPGALDAAAANPALHETLMQIALERIEEVSGGKLMRRHKLLSMKFKALPGADKPSRMTVRRGRGGEVVDGRLRPATEAQGAPPTRPSQPGFLHPCGAITPAWQLVERGRVDLAHAWKDTGRALAAESTPQALVLHIDLPGVSSAAGINLAVSSSSVELDVPGRFRLCLALRHSVLADGSGSKARFDTASQRLTLTLPVAPPARPEQLAACGAAAPGQAAEAPPQDEGAAEGEAEREACAHQAQASEPAPSMAAAAAPAPSKTANQLAWEQLHGCVADSSGQHADQAAPGSVGGLQASKPAQPAAASGLPPVLLKPRLSSSRQPVAAHLD